MFERFHMEIYHYHKGPVNDAYSENSIALNRNPVFLLVCFLRMLRSLHLYSTHWSLVTPCGDRDLSQWDQWFNSSQIAVMFQLKRKKGGKSICNMVYRHFDFSRYPTHVKTLRAYAWKSLVIQASRSHINSQLINSSLFNSLYWLAMFSNFQNFLSNLSNLQ